MVTRINDNHYNSAVRVDSSQTIEIYHKSKLVPGIEKELTPILRIFSKVLPSLGGTSWGYGSQREREVFTSQQTGEQAAPVICYESVFGGFVAGYVRKGANYLFIITNDGWWKNTSGYMHHLNYASLRAIETRRWIARSANTGISCIIDPKGRRVAETKWWEEDVLTGNIYPSETITFYTRYGNYLFIMGLIISFMLFAYTMVLKIFKK
jgi:apolipoprotein N-acyltransferase